MSVAQKRLIILFGGLAILTLFCFLWAIKGEFQQEDKCLNLVLIASSLFYLVAFSLWIVIIYSNRVSILFMHRIFLLHQDLNVQWNDNLCSYLDVVLTYFVFVCNAYLFMFCLQRADLILAKGEVLALYIFGLTTSINIVGIWFCIFFILRIIGFYNIPVE